MWSAVYKDDGTRREYGIKISGDGLGHYGLVLLKDQEGTVYRTTDRSEAYTIAAALEKADHHYYRRHFAVVEL